MLLVEIPSLVSFEVEMRGMITTLPSCKAKSSIQYLEFIIVLSATEFDRKMLRR